MAHPDRPTTEKLLRKAGFSSRQAKRLLSGGWKLVVGEEQAANDEMIELVDQIREKLQSTKKEL